MAKNSIDALRKTALAVAGALVFTASVPNAAAAAPPTNPLRCEALKLRRESHYNHCLANCSEEAQRRAVTNPQAAATRLTACETGCTSRYDAVMRRINSRPPCVSMPQQPNDRECQARLLSAEARYMICQARCEARANTRPDFDNDGCMNGCSDTYQADVNSILQTPVCATHALRAPSSPAN